MVHNYNNGLTKLFLKTCFPLYFIKKIEISAVCNQPVDTLIRVKDKMYTAYESCILSHCFIFLFVFASHLLRIHFEGHFACQHASNLLWISDRCVRLMHQAGYSVLWLSANHSSAFWDIWHAVCNRCCHLSVRCHLISCTAELKQWGKRRFSTEWERFFKHFIKITDIQMCHIPWLLREILAVCTNYPDQGLFWLHCQHTFTHTHMHIHITWGVWAPPLQAFTPHAHLN